MKLYVGITDYDWFRYLQTMQPDELNFWQPGGMRLFKALLPGEPSLFKLHSRSRFLLAREAVAARRFLGFIFRMANCGQFQKTFL